MIEKLIEILNESFEAQFSKRGLITAQHTAECLIANGVTVQKWIPVSERLPNFYPNKRRAVLVTLKDDDGKFLVTTAKYSEEYKYWYDFTESRFYRFDVLAWMLKPDAHEPPKEETQ